MLVVVIGAGAAGLVAAAEAAKQSAHVLLLEKNNKTGVKILMSGGTRCNLTHDTDARGITVAFGHARRFLQPSVGGFPPTEVVRMFSRLGVKTKVEATGKIFPVSDRAVEVRDALHAQAVAAGVEIRLGCAVNDLSRAAHCWNVSTDGQTIEADRVIVTAGGKSWPGCGTTGDAYQWLRNLGHTIVTPRPALVPLVGGFDWTHALSGITLADCQATVQQLDRGGSKPEKKKRPLLVRRGSWLFTHFGFSGPAAMDLSGALTAAASFQDVALTLDFLPDLDRVALETAFSDRRGVSGRRKIAAIVGQWLPNRIADALVQQTGDDIPVAELPRKRMLTLIEQIKRLQLPVTGTKGFAKAEVTAGGVSLDEVDPRTLASRKAAGLYIAGEVLDVDGWIGGYNFQAAFSTGRAAGIAAARD
jgi:predicted Rossmann fold flavoprotein